MKLLLLSIVIFPNLANANTSEFCSDEGDKIYLTVTNDTVKYRVNDEEQTYQLEMTRTLSAEELRADEALISEPPVSAKIYYVAFEDGRFREEGVFVDILGESGAHYLAEPYFGTLLGSTKNCQK